MMERDLPDDFMAVLKYKDVALIALYNDLRAFVLELAPECNELLYHTHALTSLFTITEKMGDGFCLIPIYTEHINFAFSKGALLPDPNGVLTGTGKLMRHIPVTKKEDYRNPTVITLVKAALALGYEDAARPSKIVGQTISKIKKKI